jgi:hypothetical protein
MKQAYHSDQQLQLAHLISIFSTAYYMFQIVVLIAYLT